MCRGKNILFVLLLLSSVAFGEHRVPSVSIDWCDFMGMVNSEEMCEICRKNQNAPEYYCDCHFGEHFAYGMDEQISGVSWYYATFEDIQKSGLTTYWLSDAPVKIELFLQCTNTEAFQTRVVGANRSMTITPEEIGEMLGDYGDLSQYVSQGMKLRFRVTPSEGSTGRVLCYKAEEGFHSTCEQTYSVYFDMNYYMSSSDNVYVMRAEDFSGDFFVQWREDSGARLQMDIVEGDCSGASSGHIELFDSLKVWVPSEELIRQVRESGEDVYFRFHSEQNGVIRFVSPIDWTRNVIDETVCEGKSYKIGDKEYTESQQIEDTLWVENNRLSLTTINLTVSPAVVVYDTLYFAVEDLPVLYKHNNFRIREFGDFEVREHHEGECDVVYALHVGEKTTAALSELHTSSCRYSVDGGKLSIELSEESDVLVCDILGSVVYSSRLSGVAGVELPEKGNYILRVVNSKEQIVRKILNK